MEAALAGFNHLKSIPLQEGYARKTIPSHGHAILYDLKKLKAKKQDSGCTAFLDMGTNSLRMMVVRVTPDRSYTILSRQKETIRLGEGEFENGYIREDTIIRAISVIRSFAGMARSFGANEFIAVGTSALRDASNSKEITDRIKEEAGLDIRIISGDEEARLIYLGVSRDYKIDNPSLFIDIGGGSTELAVGDGSDPSFLKSLDIGAIRLAALVQVDENGRYGKKQYDKIRSYILEACGPVLGGIKNLNLQTAYGSSGTIQNLAQIAFKMNLCEDPKDVSRLKLKHLKKVMQKLCSLTLKQRMNVPGLNPGRADIIIPGGIILETILSETGIDEIHVSRRELRDGLLVDHLDGITGSDKTKSGIRAKSILRLGRNLSFDELHAMRVLKLGASLFDSAGMAGLHSQGADKRELFGYAAILHDIGMLLSYENHHMNSMYFINNADLQGFTRKEISVIAADAFFHRKLSPSNRFRNFLCLDDDQMETVMVHASLLKIAENLDRSHAGYVSNASFKDVSDSEAVLEIKSQYNCELEIAGLNNHLKMFEKTYGKRLAPKLTRQ